MNQHVHICDTRGDANDPTGTFAIRKAWRQMLELRVRQLKTALRLAVLEQDVLGFGGGTTPTPGFTFVSRSARVKAFTDWFNDVVIKTLDGTWGGPFIQQAWNKGVFEAAALDLNLPYVVQPRDMSNHDHLLHLLKHDVDAIAAALNQQVAHLVERMSSGGVKRPAAYGMICDRIDAIAFARMRASIEYLTVKAFNQAKIEVYRVNGVGQIGVVPEHLHVKPVQDAASIEDAKKKKREKRKADLKWLKTRKSGRGVPRLTSKTMVGVRTAGDEKVCVKCEEFADGAPYTLEQASAAMPLHPRCRCAVYPWNDKRFKRGA